MKTSSKQQGSVSLDPSKMDTRDLVEGYYMLLAGCTLLKKPLSDSDLKSFANQFDIVHKTLNTFASGLKDYIDGRNKDSH